MLFGHSLWTNFAATRRRWSMTATETVRWLIGFVAVDGDDIEMRPWWLTTVQRFCFSDVYCFFFCFYTVSSSFILCMVVLGFQAFIHVFFFCHTKISVYFLFLFFLVKSPRPTIDRLVELSSVCVRAVLLFRSSKRKENLKRTSFLDRFFFLCSFYVHCIIV